MFAFLVEGFQCCKLSSTHCWREGWLKLRECYIDWMLRHDTNTCTHHILHSVLDMHNPIHNVQYSSLQELINKYWTCIIQYIMYSVLDMHNPIHNVQYSTGHA